MDIVAPTPVHGKRHRVFHRGRGIFAGLPSPFWGARYHSLQAVNVSPELEVTAWSADGVIMGLSHRQYPLHGVQFHPESFLTTHGRDLAANFLGLAEELYMGEGTKDRALTLTKNSPIPPPPIP